MDAKSADSSEGKQSLPGAKEESGRCDETIPSESFNKDTSVPAILIRPNTQTNDTIHTGNKPVPSETEIPKTMNVTTEEKNDQSDETFSNEILKRKNCNYVSSFEVQCLTTQANGSIQTESSQSPKTIYKTIDTETTQNNFGNKTPVEAEDQRDYSCSSETLENNNCSLGLPVKRFGLATHENGSNQTGNKSEPSGIEPLQSQRKLSVNTYAATEHSIGVKDSFFGANKGNAQCEDTPSSATSTNGSFSPVNSVNVEVLKTQANDHTDIASVTSERESSQLHRKVKMTTNAETLDSNEAKEEIYKCDNSSSSDTKNKDSCTSDIPIMLPIQTSERNDRIQGKKGPFPLEKGATDAKSTHDNEGNKSLSDSNKEKSQCDEKLSSKISKMDSSIQGNPIQRGQKRVTQALSSCKSSKKTNIALNTETMYSNKVNESLKRHDTIKGKDIDECKTAEAMQQNQNDNAKSECHVKDRGSVATVEEDQKCGSAMIEDVKPVHTDATKNGTNTTEPEGAQMIVPSASECVSTAMPVQGLDKRDREEQIYATLYGQCIGDAIGLLTEFMSKDEAFNHYGHKNELEYKDKIEDRHRKRWNVGDWTDDSDQMILIMQSLVDEEGVVNPNDFARRLVKWMEEGFHEHGDKGGLGIGHTTYITITRYGFEANPHKISKDVWEDSGKFLAPNGGVMRTSILGIHAWWDTNQVYQNAINICKTTHFDPRCQASAVSVCVAISLMLQRKERHYKNGEYIIQTIIEDVFNAASTCLPEAEEKRELWKYLQYQSLSELKLDEYNSIGYTYKCLGAGFWALKQPDFRKALQSIVMCGGDADTNGAVAGALLGCKLGRRECFPKSWRQLKHRDWLDTLIQKYLKVLKKKQDE